MEDELTYSHPSSGILTSTNTSQKVEMTETAPCQQHFCRAQFHNTTQTGADEARVRTKPVYNFQESTLHITENQNPRLPDLPVQLAIIEILEYMLLCCINNNQSRTNVPQLHLKIRTIGDLTTEQLLFQMKVLVTCARPNDVNMHIFLKDHASCLAKIAKEMEAAYEGDHVWTELPSVTDQNQTVSSGWHYKGALVSTQTNKTSSSGVAKIVFRVMQSKSHMLTECEELQAYMYRLGLTHPNVNLQLSLNVGGAKSSSSFCNEKPSKDPRRPVLDIEHYMNVDDSYEGVEKLQLRSSAYFKLCSGVRLSVGAALLPPPDNGSVLLNSDCAHLQLLVYGPGRLPALVPGVDKSALRPASWLPLQEYNLKLGHPNDDEPPHGTVIPDFRYHLGLLDEEMGDLEDESLRKYTIHIFMFIDEECLQDKASVKIGLMDHFRQNITTIFSKHRSKIKKGLSSALSKLLQNHLVDQQKQQLMDQVIPSITSSLTDVVRRSTTDIFRANALGCLQASDSQELCREVNRKLWTIASEKFNVQPQPNKETSENADVNSRSFTTKKNRSERLEKEEVRAKRAKTVEACESQTCETTELAAWAPTVEGLGHSPSLVSTSRPAATDLETQDLDNFDLLGLELGPDDVIPNVINDLALDSTSVDDLCDLDPELEGQRQNSHPGTGMSDQQDFDLFSCEGATGGFEEDWLNDILSNV